MISCDTLWTLQPASPMSPGHPVGLGDKAGPRSSWDVSLRCPPAPGWCLPSEWGAPTSLLQKAGESGGLGWWLQPAHPLLRPHGKTSLPAAVLTQPCGAELRQHRPETGTCPCACQLRGRSSPFKAQQQLIATCALPWHAPGALCAVAGTGTRDAPARAAVPPLGGRPLCRTGAAGGWPRMSGCPGGAAWGACHHAGSR